MRIMRMIEATVGLVLVCATSASTQVIDDFESYADTPELEAVWSFATLDTVTPTPGPGTQSLRREGSDLAPTNGIFTLRQFDPPLDLSGMPGLEVRVRRDPASVAMLQVEIFMDDGAAHGCFSAGIPLISDTAWHTMTLSFPDLCVPVDLTDIVAISLSAKNLSSGTGDILVNFDDLAVSLLQDGFETGDLSRWSATVP